MKILEHLQNLENVANCYSDFTIRLTMTQYRKLRHYEVALHRLNEQYCNGEISDEEFCRFCEKYTLKTKLILGADFPLYVNGDPRGMSLKVLLDSDKIGNETYLRFFKDFGNYGLVAPLFDKKTGEIK